MKKRAIPLLLVVAINFSTIPILPAPVQSPKASIEISNPILETSPFQNMFDQYEETGKYQIGQREDLGKKVKTYIHAIASGGHSSRGEHEKFLEFLRTGGKEGLGLDADICDEFLKDRVPSMAINVFIKEGDRRIQELSSTMDAQELSTLQQLFIIKIVALLDRYFHEKMFEVVNVIDSHLHYWKEQQIHPTSYFLHKSPVKWFTGQPQTKEVERTVSGLELLKKQHFSLSGVLAILGDQFSSTSNNFEWANEYLGIMYSGFQGMLKVRKDQEFKPHYETLIGAIQKMLNDMIKVYPARMKVRMDSLGLSKPSHIERRWFDYLVTGVVLGGASYYLYTHRKDIPGWYETMKKNFIDTPVENIKWLFFPNLYKSKEEQAPERAQGKQGSGTVERGQEQGIGETQKKIIDQIVEEKIEIAPEKTIEQAFDGIVQGITNLNDAITNAGDDFLKKLGLDKPAVPKSTALIEKEATQAMKSFKKFREFHELPDSGLNEGLAGYISQEGKDIQNDPTFIWTCLNQIVDDLGALSKKSQVSNEQKNENDPVQPINSPVRLPQEQDPTPIMFRLAENLWSKGVEIKDNVQHGGQVATQVGRQVELLTQLASFVMLYRDIGMTPAKDVALGLLKNDVYKYKKEIGDNCLQLGKKLTSLLKDLQDKSDRIDSTTRLLACFPLAAAGIAVAAGAYVGGKALLPKANFGPMRTALSEVGDLLIGYTGTGDMKPTHYGELLFLVRKLKHEARIVPKQFSKHYEIDIRKLESQLSVDRKLHVIDSMYRRYPFLVA